MRRSISIGVSAVIAALFTHGTVYSAVNFDRPFPISVYQRFFQQILLETERLWSYAHGWQPISHIRDFGHFYAPAIQLLCPLIGFALFSIVSRHKLGLNVWKPLTIAILLTIAPSVSNLASHDAIPCVEAARTGFIVLAMAWSVGAVRFPTPV